MKNTKQSGFSLYELMITVLIVGVVLAYGIPNMREFRQNSRMTATVNDLHATFHLARSEASRAKTNITICSSTDPEAVLPVCGGEFENGWIVFQDTDGDIAVDAGEAVLQRYPPTPLGVTINSQGATDYFSFAPTGQGRGNVSGTAVSQLVLCDDRGNVLGGSGYSSARALVVTPLGRAAVLRDIAQVTAQGGC